MMESKTIEKLARELDYAKFEREQISLVLKETKSTLQKIMTEENSLKARIRFLESSLDKKTIENQHLKREIKHLMDDNYDLANKVDAIQRTPFGPVSLPRISKVQKKKQEGKENDDDSKNSIDFSKRQSDNQISGNGSTDDLLSTNDNINSTDYSLVHNNEASISNVSTISSDQSINAHQLPDYVNEINRLRMELLLLPCKQLDDTPLKYQCTVDNCNDIPRRYDYMRYHQIIDHLTHDFDIMFHMVIVSNTDGKRIMKPKCKICNMVFTNKGPVKTHMVSSHIILHEDYENIGTENTAQNQSDTDYNDN